MGLSSVFLLLFLLRFAVSINDDSIEGFELFVPEDESDLESYIDRQTRNNDKFLRFGKAFWDYSDAGNDAAAMYIDKEAPRPSRTGSLSGNPQQRSTRDKSSFLRFGRSIDEDAKKKREKRAVSETFKRHENYLRFGRSSNSNFLRFGRTLRLPSYESRNKYLINYLRNLLRQSLENGSRKN
ncbi:hypothetical protein ABEB36_006020 [Hypothenemus hampei]|uniref:Uncharacterized protein n=1 Tax=Hypothenemus hampei TaxID=57062 RepID=A0ABD1F3B8_HYPHA